MRLCKSDRDFYAREPYKLKLVSGKRFERSNTSESTEDYRNRISDAINYMTNESFTNNIFSMYDDKTAHAINIVIQKDGLYAFYDDNHGSFEYKSFDEFKHNFSGFLEAFYNYYYDFVVEQFKSAESIRSYKDEESDEISF